MITLSSLVKTAKGYAIDSSITDEEFLNALLAPYVEAGRIKGRGGVEYRLDASRTSKILNGKADVPKTLRRQLGRIGMAEETENGMGLFLSDYIDPAGVRGLVEAIISLDGDLRAGVESELAPGNDNPPRFLATALIAAIKSNNLSFVSQALWFNGTGSFSVEVGDLFSKGFGRRKRVKNIVVIPVNSTFDTELNWGYECIGNPCVSPVTLHGQWLERMSRCGESGESISMRIRENLKLRGICPVGVENGRKRYPTGTIAVIETGGAVFYLLAISDFDNANKATSDSGRIRLALNSLIDEYDSKGQGLELYLPLMGTGLSRAGLTHEGAYSLILNVFSERMNDLHGPVVLMVRPDDFEKVGEGGTGIREEMARAI